MRNKHTPEIRFEEFSGEWEERNLGDITNYIKGFAFKSTDYKQTGFRVIRVSDLSEDNIKNANDNIYIKFDDYHFYEKYRVNYKDIIITTVGSKAEMKESAVGRPIIIKSTEDYLLNQNLVKVNPKKEYESYFIYCQLLQPIYKDYLVMIERGNANQANIAIKDLWKYVLQVPSKGEQAKIGNFFEKIDETIALQQQELDNLKQTKQGFLQKMFPKKGDSMPEVRFAGFNDDWIQCKIGEITDSYSGGTPSAGNKLYYGESIPFIRSAEINSESTELFLTEDGLNNSSAKMVESGDILYALYGATSGEVGISKIHGAINQAILAMKPKFDNDSYFISQWLKKQKHSIISTYLQGGQGNLSGSIVRDLIIPIPINKEEQIKIGNFFKQLDEIIDLHQQELEALQKTKKGFLQKMFV